MKVYDLARQTLRELLKGDFTRHLQELQWSSDRFADDSNLISVSQRLRTRQDIVPAGMSPFGIDECASRDVSDVSLIDRGGHRSPKCHALLLRAGRPKRRETVHAQKTAEAASCDRAVSTPGSLGLLRQLRNRDHPRDAETIVEHAKFAAPKRIL